MFRYPKSTHDDAAMYYQSAYAVFERGAVTSVPDAAYLSSVVAKKFVGTKWDASERIAIIRRYCKAGRLLDFGCSWGYFVWQAEHAGYDAFGFEISMGRAAFGRRRLHVSILSSIDELDALKPDSLDVIYTSHTLEHLSSLYGVFERFSRLLKPDGVLLIFVPNCGGENAQRDGLNWGGFANEAHTISFDAAWFRATLPLHGFDVECFSEPYRPFAHDDGPIGSPACDGDELLVAARKRR